MLFLQPVVVNTGAVDQPPPAEVRVANRSAAEQPTSHPTWTGTVLAQGAMDQRSPFGTNAPNANDGTPDFVVPNPASQNQPAPGGTTSNGPLGDPSSTKIPPAPAPNRPDAGPPPPNASSSSPSLVAPPPETPPATATPGTTPSTSTPNTTTTGAGNASGSATTPAPSSAGSPMQPPSSSSTFPGANSGASSTR